MASVVISGDTSGSVTLSAPAVAGTTTLTLPSTSGTVLTTASTTGISGSAISTGTVAEAYGGTGTSTGYYGFKNRIINGAMVIDQRNAGASVNSPSTAATAYTLDRWQVRGDTEGVFSIQQNSSAPDGFVNSLKITVTTIDSSLGATQLYNVSQPIEGTNVSDLGFGTATAKTVTLSFWVRSSLTGTFGGALRNSGSSRSYPFTYTISVADTWEYKTVTIPGDTSGTWLTTTGIGISVLFALGAGADRTGTAGAWVAANNSSATGATNVMATLNATWYITGVQLEKGSTATSFDYRPFGAELALCQRYCFVPASSSRYVGQCDATTRALIIYVFPQTMRSGPNATLASAATYNVTTAAGGTVAGTSVVLGGGYTNTAQVAISVASGLVAGNATLVTASGTTIFSAEL